MQVRFHGRHAPKHSCTTMAAMSPDRLPDPTEQSALMNVGEVVREWWVSPVDFQWLREFLASRSLTDPVRLLIALIAALLAVVPALGLLTHDAPDHIAGRALLVVAMVTAAAWSVRWLRGPWPTAFGSALFVIWADIAITVCCLLHGNALSGLAGTTTFVLIGAYVTFFHGPRPLCAQLAWSLLTVVALAIPVATGPDGDPATAIGKAFVTIAAVVVLPPILQISYTLIRSDAVDSLVDPLTGLLNRRGLQTQSIQLARGQRVAGDTVVLISIDLDRFKTINDTLGHSVGDEVLLRSARRIRSVVRSDAVLARLGGEEFVVLDVLPLTHADELAERIRVAISAKADRAPVTASVGFAIAKRDLFAGSAADAVDALEQLLDRADTAMYEAKRAGRDRVSRDIADIRDSSDDDALES